MRKFGLTIFCIFLLTLSPVMGEVQESSLSSDFLSLLSKLIADKHFRAKLGETLRLGPIEPSASKCQYCTMLAGTALKYIQINNITIDEFVINRLCPMFPVEIKPICQEFVKVFGPIIIESFLKYESADKACRDIGVCDNHKCTLFPKNARVGLKVSEEWVQTQRQQPATEEPISTRSSSSSIFSGLRESIVHRLLSGEISPKELSKLIEFIEQLERSAGDSPFDWIKQLIEKWTGNHTTPIDIDKDAFSRYTAELRGYNWRGRDCDDLDKYVYPGRKVNHYPDSATDFNCNGIKGKNPKTKAHYKDELCANSQQMGVVVMGDSAGAHAEIPVNWFTAELWNQTTFQSILSVVLNEVDLPHMSTFTGYTETGITGPVRSIYKYLYERNKCNFRDYQNIAVNGAKSSNCYENNMRLARNKDADHPVLIFFELIGNDVCNHRPSFDVMTKPEAFKRDIQKNLDYIDSVVPSGSHMVVIGVANGSVIFDGLDGRMHPVGVTFNELFDYENCLESSFCWGWLNNDKSVRDKTTQRAMELNQVYKDLFKTYKPKNFDIIYYDFPAEEIFEDYVKNGGDPLDLIEPTDGFHPSQIFNALFADYLWENLQRDRPEWLGPINPNNDLITQLFGDQGGY